MTWPCQCTCSSYLNRAPILVTALYLLFHYSLAIVKKTNLHGSFQTVIFHHNAPNSHVPGINFLQLLVHALSITSYHSWKWCLQKSYCICRKIPLFLAKQYLIWLLKLIELKYKTNLKIYNAEVNLKCLWYNFVVSICCVQAVFARFKTKICSKFFRFLATTTEKPVIWGPELRL